jgi:hypothetical protein
MKRIFRPAIVAIFCSLVGLAVGVVIEYKAEQEFEREKAEMIREEERTGLSPPQVTRVNANAIPTASAALFAIGGTAVYSLCYWISSRKSS